MINDLGLTGIVFTADAMPSRQTFGAKKTFQAASASGNALIAQVKANQQALLDTLDMIATENHPIDSFESTDRHRHGRHEYRLIETFNVEGHLKDGGDEHIKIAARVTRHTWRKNTKNGLWDQSSDIALYASQRPLTAQTIGAAIRHHWGIENTNNDVRDVSFFEDHSRIQNKPVHLARLRSFALNILRANDTKNVCQELFINARNPANLMSYAVT